VAVAAAKRFWRPAVRGAPYRWIGDHVPRWLDNAGDHYLVRQAKEIYVTMHPTDATLVHGDFHHHNLLSNRDGWVVIDPKPMVGDPEFDVPTFLWNPIGHLPTRESVERWIGAFAEAGLDANLLRKWAIVRGTYQGLPLSQGLTAETTPALRVVRALL
jgi:streptomycin 6-kinase